MKIYLLAIPMLAASTLMGVFPGNAQASGNGEKYCTQTARSLFSACRADAKDGFREALANCINVIDGAERASCFSNARLARHEDIQGCGEQRIARVEVCDLIGEQRYADPLRDPGITFIEPDEIGEGLSYPPNQYVNLTSGHTYVLRAGEDFEETVIIHVTDEIREAEGATEGEPVLCRVVVDAALIAETDEDGNFEEWVAQELTDDYFAQDADSNVYYCGEISRNFEDGYLDNLDGSFFTGVEFAKAGVLIRQYPSAGQVDRQEFTVAEAEDVVEYLDLSAAPGEDEGGQNLNQPDFACSGVVGDCLKTRDSTALDPESTEYKYYRGGVGFVLAVALEDGEVTGEREELVCVGDSLDILQTDCGLENVEELLETLCEISPEAFCSEE